MSNKLTFRRLLDTFVPGFIVVFSIWYLFRPYLQKYFPTIAFDPSSETFSSEFKLVAFLTIVLFFGILINHLSDIAIALIYNSHEDAKDKSNRPYKKIAKSVFGFFVWSNYADPRCIAIERYLNSNRRGLFLDMVKEWTNSHEEELKFSKEKSIVHQHLCARLKLISELTEKNFDNAFSEVAFSASLFTSFFLTFFVTVSALLLSTYFPIEQKISNQKYFMIGLLFLEYLICFLLNFSLRRRFRHFCSQVVTISINQFIIEKSTSAKTGVNT